MEGRIVTKIYGCDPGSAGCIVELDFDTKACRYLKLPWIEYKQEKILDVNKIAKAFPDLSKYPVWLEDVNSDPKWTHVTNFSFGRNHGQAMLFLYSFGHLNFVPPKSWQNNIYKRDKIKYKSAKDQTLAAFTALYPNFTYVANRHEGFIDAYFIALYGMWRTGETTKPPSFSFSSAL